MSAPGLYALRSNRPLAFGRANCFAAKTDTFFLIFALGVGSVVVYAPQLDPKCPKMLRGPLTSRLHSFPSNPNWPGSPYSYQA